MSKYFRFPMLVAAAGSLLVLAACGNKGPLVKPQKPVEVPVEVPAEAPAAEPQADAGPVDPSPASQVDADQKEPAAVDQGNE